MGRIFASEIWEAYFWGAYMYYQNFTVYQQYRHIKNQISVC